MMISFKPYGYSKESIFSAVEAMTHPYAFSGLKRRELEEFFCDATGRRYALVVRELISPLLVLLRYLGITDKSKVLLSPVSYFKHFSPYLKLLGIEVVYADIERWFFNIDVKRLSHVLSDEIKIAVIGNSLGIPADWDAIMSLLNGKSVFIIEDSRETIFTEYKGKVVGAFGDVSLLGFSESSLITGYGGVVLTDEEKIYRKLEGEVELLDDIMSSILVSQIKHLEEKLKIRQSLAHLYSDLLTGIEGLKPHFYPRYVTRICQNHFCVHLGKRYSDSARGIIKDLLLDDGIEVDEYPASQDIKEGMPMKHLHIAHEVSMRALLLPFHEDITQEDIYFVCERLKEHVLQIGAGSVDH